MARGGVASADVSAGKRRWGALRISLDDFETGDAHFTHGVIDPVRHEPAAHNFDLMDSLVLCGCLEIAWQGGLTREAVEKIFDRPAL